MIRSLWLSALLAAVPITTAQAEPAATASAWRHLDVTRATERLSGHRFTVGADRKSLRILDIAGQGPAMIGVIERQGEHLVLIDERGKRHRLAGPLAIPRIAGPGYAVWLIGERRGTDLVVQRIGVLAAPAQTR